MALDEIIKAQLKQYLELLESDVVFQASLGQDERSEQVRAFLEEIVAMSPRLSLENIETNRKPSFTVTQVGQEPLACLPSSQRGNGQHARLGF